MILFAKLVPAVTLFFKFFLPFLRWSTNAIADRQVTIEEAMDAMRTFWPCKDENGNPLPISVPFGKRMVSPAQQVENDATNKEANEGADKAGKEGQNQ